MPFIPFLRGSCRALPVPCGDSGLAESKFRGVVGGVSRQEGAGGAVPLPSCSCWSFSWSCGSPVGCCRGQPLAARVGRGLPFTSGSVQPPGAATRLTFSSRTSGVARGSFLKRRKKHPKNALWDHGRVGVVPPAIPWDLGTSWLLAPSET